MVFLRSEARHVGFRTVRQQPLRGDRVLWDGEGWYYSRPGEVADWTLEHGQRVRKVSYWRRQVGPHAVCARLRYFDEFSRLQKWPRGYFHVFTDEFIEGVVVDCTHDWECYRSPRARLEHQRMSAYLGESWNRPHRVEREFIPVTEITEPEPFVWPAWADEE